MPGAGRAASCVAAGLARPRAGSRAGTGIARARRRGVVTTQPTSLSSTWSSAAAAATADRRVPRRRPTTSSTRSAASDSAAHCSAGGPSTTTTASIASVRRVRASRSRPTGTSPPPERASCRRSMRVSTTLTRPGTSSGSSRSGCTSSRAATAASSVTSTTRRPRRTSASAVCRATVVVPLPVVAPVTRTLRSSRVSASPGTRATSRSNVGRSTSAGCSTQRPGCGSRGTLASTSWPVCRRTSPSVRSRPRARSQPQATAKPSISPPTAATPRIST